LFAKHVLQEWPLLLKERLGGSGQTIRVILIQRNKQRFPRLAADSAAYVPLAGGVFRQKDITEMKDPFRAVAEFDLDCALQIYYVLSPWSFVKIIILGAVCFPKDNPGGLY